MKSPKKKRKSKTTSQTRALQLAPKPKPTPWVPPHPIISGTPTVEGGFILKASTTILVPNVQEVKDEIPATTGPLKQKIIHHKEEHIRKEFLNTFRSLTTRWRSWDIWADFITMVACTISNSVDELHFEEREKTYLRIINKYDKQERELFPTLFAYVVLALEEHPDSNYYKNTVIVDSWNNIGKYTAVKDAFFIFDEQRVVGYGAWTKAFLKIVKSNQWILLSATPGDTWADYIPVFIANGFYRNKTDFVDQHVNYDWRAKYPKIDSYRNTGRLIRLRNSILVTMDFNRQTVSHHEDVQVPYDISKYKEIMRKRWNPWEDRPIETAAELCMALRRVVNSDEARSVAVLEILEDHPKAIIFYSYDYELDILRSLGYSEGTEVAEWNGHKHQEIPTGDKWV